MNENLSLAVMPLSELKAVITEVITGLIESKSNKVVLHEQQEPFLSRKEAAKILGVSLTTLNLLTKSGDIKGYRLGGSVKYKAKDLDVSLKQINAPKSN